MPERFRGGCPFGAPRWLREVSPGGCVPAIRAYPSGGSRTPPPSRCASSCGVADLCGYVGQHDLPADKFTGFAMGVIIVPLHLLIALVPAAIGLLILYWVIRLAVRHGIRDSRK